MKRIATRAKVVYYGNSVAVMLMCNDGSASCVEFPRKKTWSHKKYVDKALDGSPASWDFKYGWAHIDISEAEKLYGPEKAAALVHEALVRDAMGGEA